MQALHIRKPQGHVQQNGCLLPQQLQMYSRLRVLAPLLPDMTGRPRFESQDFVEFKAFPGP